MDKAGEGQTTPHKEDTIENDPDAHPEKTLRPWVREQIRSISIGIILLSLRSLLSFGPILDGFGFILGVSLIGGGVLSLLAGWSRGTPFYESQ